METESIGRKRWVIPGGRIPMESTGKEPDLLSQDRIAVLNIDPKPVKIHITVFYNDEDPVGEHIIEIGGKRIRKIRINDLIEPFPVDLEKDYGLLIEAENKVVVQFLRMDTGSRHRAIMGAMAFGTD